MTAGSVEAEVLEQLVAALRAPLEVIAEAVVADPDVLRAVRGGVAEVMASRQLAAEAGVVGVQRATSPSDRLVRLADGRMIRVEVKVVDAVAYADGSHKVDLRRTTGERLYRPSDFEVLAACLVSHTGTWDYRFRASALLARRSVEGVERLEPNVRVGADWHDDLASALAGVPADGFDLAALHQPQPQLFDL